MKPDESDAVSNAEKHPYRHQCRKEFKLEYRTRITKGGFKAKTPVLSLHITKSLMISQRVRDWYD